jgi:hypothetical protein
LRLSLPDFDPNYLGARAFFEPCWQLAAALGLAETRLTTRLREHSGLSARDWWDALRIEVGDFKNILRAQIHAELADALGAAKPEAPLDFYEYRQLLHAHRKENCYDRTSRAVELGFRNHARFNRAFLFVTGKTVAQFENIIVREFSRDQAAKAAGTSAESKDPNTPSTARSADDVLHHGATFSTPNENPRIAQPESSANSDQKESPNSAPDADPGLPAVAVVPLAAAVGSQCVAVGGAADPNLSRSLSVPADSSRSAQTPLGNVPPQSEARRNTPETSSAELAPTPANAAALRRARQAEREQSRRERKKRKRQDLQRQEPQHHELQQQERQRQALERQAEQERQHQDLERQERQRAALERAQDASDSVTKYLPAPKSYQRPVW